MRNVSRAAAIIAATCLDAAAYGDFAADLQTLRDASAEFDSQHAAQEAWARVASAGPGELAHILSAKSGAGPLGENWLRSAADAIAERTLRDGRELPQSRLEQFVLDLDQPPRGRRVAFEWLRKTDPSIPGRLLPGMMNDPSLEIRYDAVQRAMDAADSETDTEARTIAYLKAFESARDIGQIRACASALKQLGQPAAVAQQMGFIGRWHVIGPFDNSELEGFGVAYPPEDRIDFDAEYDGQYGPVAWQTYETDDEFGIIDLNAALADYKSAVAYAVATITSSTPQQVEIRLGSTNAVRVWLDGQEVGAYEVYHSGEAIDQYVMPVELSAGKHTLLVKVCQNAKNMPSQRNWRFQLRVTDRLGGAADVQYE